MHSEFKKWNIGALPSKSDIMHLIGILQFNWKFNWLLEKLHGQQILHVKQSTSGKTFWVVSALGLFSLGTL